MQARLQKAPIRNESVVAARVYSHSGEFSPQVTDLVLPGRGLSFTFTRKYCSALSQAMESLGRGWTFTYAKSIERENRDLLYHDGNGRIHRFTQGDAQEVYTAPELYAVLTSQNNQFLLQGRYGAILTFEAPEDGGRLLSIADRNGNTLTFVYGPDLIHVTEPLGREILVTYSKGRVVQVQDHGGRAWQYRYDQNSCLTDITQPPTDAFPDGPRTHYGYDDAFRLISITDPKGQLFLQNAYDDQGRIIQQQHGEGSYQLQYETIGQSEEGFPIYRTTVLQKNNARSFLEHDALGHVVKRTLFVSAASLSSEDRGESADGTVPLVISAKYNQYGEVVEQVFPAGNSIRWAYDVEGQDPRVRGNLLTRRQQPAPDTESDQSEIVTQYTYEPVFQRRRSIIDPRGHRINFEYDGRGNLTRRTYPEITVQQVGIEQDGGHRTDVRQLSETFAYNAAGQLIQASDARGAVTQYSYYPSDDPTGERGQDGAQSDPEQAGGYLARLVKDPASENRQLQGNPAQVTRGYSYDINGNPATVLDGKGNATHFTYNTHNRVVEMVARQPLGYKTAFGYDANDNLLEARTSFDHHQYDPATRTTGLQSTTAFQLFEYNSLDKVVRRTIRANDREITQTFVRDSDENIVREIQPLGNVIEYEYDERGLQVARRFGVGTKDEVAVRHTYTRNGRLRSTLDGRGNIARYDYDGFHRYRGFANAAGTAKRQWLDAMGNVTRVQVQGDLVTVNEHGDPVSREVAPLLESWFQYDELNRRVRVDRAWNDPLTGEPLGKSQWDGKEGVVSAVIEYSDSNLLARIWQETGNITHLDYDGANRPILVSDETGESVSIDYDENSNPIRVEHLGPPLVGEGEDRVRQLINFEFDALDRVVAGSLDGGPRASWDYNALGLVTEYKNEAEVSTKYLHDGFGRLSGRATTAAVPPSVDGKESEQLLVQRVERDDNNRLVAWINAADHRTGYTYDALNRLSSIVYTDGTVKQFERDGNGNIVRLVDPNRTAVNNRFDTQNRLAERLIESANGGDRQAERFHYDGLNRLVAAATNGATTTRRYDSLSRLLEESQSGRAVGYRYDSAGNRVRLIYPGGQEVRKSYDALGRVTRVLDEQNRHIASYGYASSTRLREQNLGGVLQASFTYETDKDWLRSIAYHSAETSEVIEGSTYHYDAVGNCIEEIQVRRGKDAGERYFYDSANRLVKVQYGVRSLSDPESPFEQEVLYELSPTGIWQRKTTRDADGQTIEQDAGVANVREAYLSLGHSRFAYDANGNRALEENGEDPEFAEKRYSYDYANRLVRVESLKADGQVAQTIEYAYDAFNRQVLKRIGKDGETREYVRVWDGSQLIEEWQDGTLAKSFAYGSRIDEPLLMHSYSSRGTEKYFYSHDGHGWISGLFDTSGNPVEQYHYDVDGLPSLVNEQGQAIEQGAFASRLGNPLLAFGYTWDDDTVFYTRSDSTFDPHTAQAVDGGNNGSVITIPPVTIGDSSGSVITIPPVTIDDSSGGVPIAPKKPKYTHAEGDGLVVGGSGLAVTGVGLGLAGAIAPIPLGWKIVLGIIGGFAVVIGGGYAYSGYVNQGPNSDSSGGPSDNNSGHSSGSSGDQPTGPLGQSYGDRPTPGDRGSSSSDPSSPQTSVDGGTEPAPSPTPEPEPAPKSPEPAPKKDDKSGSDEPKKDEPKDDKSQKKDEPKGDGQPTSPDIATPNPEDPGSGSGEGIDKDWWRGLPNASAIDVARAHGAAGWKVDERGETPSFSLGAGGVSSLLSVLTPPPIGVDPGGESLTLNLAGLHSRSMSTGTTTSDDWGDTPWNWAQAAAAPRI